MFAASYGPVACARQDSPSFYAPRAPREASFRASGRDSDASEAPSRRPNRPLREAPHALCGECESAPTIVRFDAAHALRQARAGPNRPVESSGEASREGTGGRDFEVTSRRAGRTPVCAGGGGGRGTGAISPDLPSSDAMCAFNAWHGGRQLVALPIGIGFAPPRRGTPSPCPPPPGGRRGVRLGEGEDDYGCPGLRARRGAPAEPRTPIENGLAFGLFGEPPTCSRSSARRPPRARAFLSAPQGAALP